MVDSGYLAMMALIVFFGDPKITVSGLVVAFTVVFGYISYFSTTNMQIVSRKYLSLNFIVFKDLSKGHSIKITVFIYFLFDLAVPIKIDLLI